MVERFWKRVVLKGGIPQRQNYLPYQVSYLCRQINISWYTFQRRVRSVQVNQLLVTMETIVYMLVLDIPDKELISNFSSLLINVKKTKCILALDDAWFWQFANRSWKFLFEI